MEKISRRNVIGVAAAALAGGAFAGGAVPVLGGSPDPKKTEKAKGAKTESIYKFRFADAPARKYGESTIREHKLNNFPISASMAAALIRLAKGDFREPHWHPNSDEWLFVMSGQVQMTIVNGKGEASRFTCGPEEVAFTPQGFGHYVENVGDSDADLMLIHNHPEFTTVELSEWVAGGSPSIFASTMNMPVEALAKAPKERLFIAKKKRGK